MKLEDAFLRVVLPATAMLVLMVVAATLGAEDDDDRPKRARRPTWSQDVIGTFYDDFRRHLVGERPDYAALAKASRSVPAAKQADSGEPDVAHGQKFAWSKLIAPDTVESEIKRLANEIRANVTTPTAFKGGAYRRCRRLFSMTAVLFGIIDQYDERIRWQDADPAGLRDMFARAAANCKVGTDPSYNEAKLRLADIEELIRGSRVDTAKPAEDFVWADIADRAPLMQRMKLAHEQRLGQWTARSAEFRANRDEIRHEAQILAMLAEIVGREGYEFADDDEYAAHAAQLRSASKDIAAAAEQENYSLAEQAMASAYKSCTNCHEGFQ